MTPFGFRSAGGIRFGRGASAGLAGEAARMGASLLLVRGRSVPFAGGFAADAARAGCRVAEIFAQGEPAVADVEAAAQAGRAAGARLVVAIGGGAVMDLAKAAAAMIPAPRRLMDHLEGAGGGLPLEAAPLPVIAVPTTAGTGSEVTRNAVIAVPESGRKVSLRDPRMIPVLAVVDPALTDHSPASVTFASGLDALTQVIEPYLSCRANPLTDALCRAAIPMAAQALARLAQGEDAAARDAMACASLSGGLALANAGLGAVHGLAGVIGGRFGAPHGLICGRLLGPVLAANRDAARAAGADMARYGEIAGTLAEAFGLPHDGAFEGLGGWIGTLGLPRLGAWIGETADLEALAAEAAGTSSMKANPAVLPEEVLAAAVRSAL